MTLYIGKIFSMCNGNIFCRMCISKKVVIKKSPIAFSLIAITYKSVDLGK
jgi:hypothetical protein